MPVAPHPFALSATAAIILLAACSSTVHAARPAGPPPARIAAAPAGEALAIRLHRPVKPGQRFNEVTTARYKTTVLKRTRKGTATTATESWSISFEADQEVLATTPGGSPKAYRIEFKDFTMTGPKGKESVFKRGDVVIAWADANGSTFTKGGEELEQPLQSTLSDLFGMSDADQNITMDDVYATARPRRVGEGWPVDLEKATLWFEDPGAPMRVLAISGSSRLVRRLTVDGVDCIQFGHTISARQRSPMVWMQGAQGLEIHFLSAMLSTLPLDPTLMERGYTSFKRHRYVNPADDGDPGSNNEVVKESSYETKIRPLPANPDPSSGDLPLLPAKPGADAPPPLPAEPGAAEEEEMGGEHGDGE